MEPALSERVAKLEVKVESMKQDIHQININLATLTALANQGQGSLRTFLWMGGLVAGLVGLLGTLLGYFGGFGK